jgi:hypothetical protein
MTYKYLQEQAVLNTCKEMSGYVVIAGIVVLVVILAFYIFHKVNESPAKLAS